MRSSSLAAPLHLLLRGCATAPVVASDANATASAYGVGEPDGPGPTKLDPAFLLQGGLGVLLGFMMLRMCLKGCIKACADKVRSWALSRPEDSCIHRLAKVFMKEKELRSWEKLHDEDEEGDKAARKAAKKAGNEEAPIGVMLSTEGGPDLPLGVLLVGRQLSVEGFAKMAAGLLQRGSRLGSASHLELRCVLGGQQFPLHAAEQGAQPVLPFLPERVAWLALRARPLPDEGALFPATSFGADDGASQAEEAKDGLQGTDGEDGKEAKEEEQGRRRRTQESVAVSLEAGAGLALE